MSVLGINIGSFFTEFFSKGRKKYRYFRNLLFGLVSLADLIEEKGCDCLVGIGSFPNNKRNSWWTLWRVQQSQHLNLRVGRARIGTHFFSLALLLVCFAFFSGVASNAQEISEENAGSANPEILPEIEVRRYLVRPERLSHSLRVYRMKYERALETPRANKLLLLKSESQPVMAFRIVKVYPDTQELAARWVRQYGRWKSNKLEMNTSFEALEKIRDIAPLTLESSPTDIADDQRDISELEGDLDELDSEVPGLRDLSKLPLLDVDEYEADLDLGTSPVPNDDAENSRDEFLDLFGEEVLSLDPDRFGLSVQGGVFTNIGTSGSLRTFTGAGARFMLHLSKESILNLTSVQDSLSIELGVFYYKILRFDAAADTYTILPVIPTVRYNLMFGHNLMVYIYGGVVRNFLIAESNGTSAAKSSLDSSLLAGGLGFGFRLGPRWWLRADLGLDGGSLGVQLRF